MAAPRPLLAPVMMKTFDVMLGLSRMVRLNGGVRGKLCGYGQFWKPLWLSFGLMMWSLALAQFFGEETRG